MTIDRKHTAMCFDRTATEEADRLPILQAECLPKCVAGVDLQVEMSWSLADAVAAAVEEVEEGQDSWVAMESKRHFRYQWIRSGAGRTAGRKATVHVGAEVVEGRAILGEKAYETHRKDVDAGTSTWLAR